MPGAGAHIKKKVRILHVWTKDKEIKLLELHEQGLTHRHKAEIMSDLFGERFNSNTIKKKIHRMNARVEINHPEFRESVEINSDGSHRSDKLLKMSAEESKDVDYLLKAHGYDKNAWDLVSARSNIWNVFDKENGVRTLYASKITVKPKTGLNIDKLLETINNVKPFDIDTKHIEVNTKRLFEISLFDQHFGISDYEYYKPTQLSIISRLSLRYWEEVLFVVGQDLLHNDNMRGNTSSGTPIEIVDMDKAWEDASKFYIPIIKQALKQTNKVIIKYSPGNHDESISWAFVKYLKALFPQCEFDDRLQQRKIHTFHKVFIGLTHGDKEKNKELHDIFISEYPVEWANAKTREIHKGHFHVEDSKDIYGTMVRTLATRNKTDKWHKNKGFVGAHKRFMLFEYSETELESIHYV